MAQRTSALCNGKIIGIETIFTVIDGKQINIQEKLKELRKKSQNNELFCPCGCGTNLILVAGDQNIREQHFREKNGVHNSQCKQVKESKISTESKIVLKCWLDDKLSTGDIESRIPISTVENLKRKPEFTLLSREKKIAIRYWRTRASIIEDRLDVLSGNLSGIKVIYIVDASNAGQTGQYPEALMKLQERQSYCLLLSVSESTYENAMLEAVFYDKNIDGLWEEITFAKAPLNEFGITKQNQIVYAGKTLEQTCSEAKKKFLACLNEKKKHKIEEEKRIQIQNEELKKRQREYELKKKLEVEDEQEERRKREEDFVKNMMSNFSQQETQVRDADGNRWVKCEFCGKKAEIKEFTSYGGVGHVNLGTCKECSLNNPMVKEQIEKKNEERKKNNQNLCLKCGGKLIERNGKNGKFWGCSNFPACRYTKSIK